MNRSLYYTWNFFKKNLNKKTTILNFGPQHPAAHGVLRLILQLEGEIIKRADVHIGLLHRGTESLIESKHYEKGLPYFDRLDYVSMMTQEHSYCLAIEYLQGFINSNLSVNFIRVIFDELTRLLNHFLAIACHALDIGSMSTIFWAFEEREKLMEFYERVSGARMHAAFHRPITQFDFFLEKNFFQDLIIFIKNCYTTLNEIHNVLTYNKIWKQRLINIGVIDSQLCINYSLTGVLSRSCGLKRDLRLSKLSTYSSYNKVYLRSFIGINGDTYDRYLIRMLEMGESLSIINSLIFFFTKTPSFSNLNLNISNYFLSNNLKNNLFDSTTSMEDLITHFLRWQSGIKISQNYTDIFIESPKGEFGVSIISNNTSKPVRCKIRSPSYLNLQALPKLINGHYLADLAALIGTIDIVFGEVDR